MFHVPALRRTSAVAAALGLLILSSGVVAAHEEREVAGYSVVVGFMGEPVYVGQKSGLEFFVNKGEVPVEGLEETVRASVTYQGQTRELPVSARYGEAGTYQSVFFPTAAGPYTFRLTGAIEGTAIDESFTSKPDGFNEVQELSGGQFPVQFPAQAQIVADARAGQTAASQVNLALGLGAAGVLIGLVGVGLALATRRRPA